MSVLVLTARLRPSAIGAFVLAVALTGRAECQGVPRAAVSPAATARVRGSVVAADSGRPIRRATVRLVAAMGGTWMAIADNDGRFEMSDLPAGRFVLTAAKAGYVVAGGGRAAGARAGRTIELAAGQTLDNVVITLSRGAVIAGTVVDEFGDPVIDAFVQAFRADYVQGVRRLSPIRSVQSNDIGQFRFYGLPPGRYYVAVALRQSGAIGERVEVERGGRGFAPTFFPGTAIAAEARPIPVAAGEEALGVDFALVDARLARIAGSVVSSRGTPARDYVVLLNPARSDRPTLSPAAFPLAETDADGRFSLSNIAPGEYRVDVRAKSEIDAIAQTGQVGQTPETAGLEFASTVLVVSGSDVESLVLTASPGFRMSGRVVFNGVSPGARRMRTIRVSAIDMTAGDGVSGVLLNAGAPVQADASFEIPRVTGKRLVRVSGLPPGWALESVRLAGGDVTDTGLDIWGDVAGVEVAITSSPAHVAGAVVNRTGNPVPECQVIVFPADAARWSGRFNRFVASARTREDGTFTIDQPMPPGAYLAVAVDEVDAGEWAEPDNLERLRPLATKFSLAEGEQEHLVLPAPRDR